MLELRRYRDRLRAYEYQELLHLCRSLAVQHSNGGTHGNGRQPQV